MVTVTEVPCSWKGAAPGTEKASRFGTTKPGAKEKRDTQRTRWRKNRKGTPGSVSQAGQWHLDTRAPPSEASGVRVSAPPTGGARPQQELHSAQTGFWGHRGGHSCSSEVPTRPSARASSGVRPLFRVLRTAGARDEGARREGRVSSQAPSPSSHRAHDPRPHPTPRWRAPADCLFSGQEKNLGAARGCPGDDPGTALESRAERGPRGGVGQREAHPHELSEKGCELQDAGGLLRAQPFPAQGAEQSRAGKEFQSIGKHTFRGCKWGEMVLQICRDEPLQRPPAGC